MGLGQSLGAHQGVQALCLSLPAHSVKGALVVGVVSKDSHMGLGTGELCRVGRVFGMLEGPKDWDRHW